MKIVAQQMGLDELELMAERMFGDMVKAVVESSEIRDRIIQVAAKRIKR